MSLPQDPDLVAALLNLIRLEGDLHTVQYVLTLLCEIVRGRDKLYTLDEGRFSSFLRVFVSSLRVSSVSVV